MAHLAVSHRYDQLRITLNPCSSQPEDLNSLQNEFVQLLQSTSDRQAVIVELPAVGRLDSGLLRLLITWQRIALMAGRRFRMNGLSQLVEQVLDGVGEVGHARRSSLRGPSPRAVFSRA